MCTQVLNYWIFIIFVLPSYRPCFAYSNIVPLKIVLLRISLRIPSAMSAWNSCENYRFIIVIPLRVMWAEWVFFLCMETHSHTHKIALLWWLPFSKDWFLFTCAHLHFAMCSYKSEALRLTILCRSNNDVVVCMAYTYIDLHILQDNKRRSSKYSSLKQKTTCQNKSFSSWEWWWWHRRRQRRHWRRHRKIEAAQRTARCKILISLFIRVCLYASIRLCNVIVKSNKHIYALRFDLSSHLCIRLLSVSMFAFHLDARVSQSFTSVLRECVSVCVVHVKYLLIITIIILKPLRWNIKLLSNVCGHPSLFIIWQIFDGCACAMQVFGDDDFLFYAHQLIEFENSPVGNVAVTIWCTTHSSFVLPHAQQHQNRWINKTKWKKTSKHIT